MDGSGYIFRAYHALPPLTRKSDGLQVNAVLGFCNMLWKLLAEMKDDKPTHLAVVFDKSEKTFRTDFYPEYKAHRPDAPADLIPQFPLIREAVHAFEIPCLEQAGYEADDLIATYARLACEAKATTTIVSSDKDLMQLVGNGVTMYDTMKDKRIGAAEVIEKFGVGPDKVIEVQALIGDSSDNVPGVPGIGVKTAAQLIGEYGDLETLLKRASEIKQDKRRQSLIDNAEIARISKRLVTLDQNVPLDVPVDQLAVHEPDYKHLIAFLKAMEFNTITRRVAEKSGIDASAVEADAKLSSSPPPPAAEVGPRSGPGGATGDLFAPPPRPSPASGGGRAGAAPSSLTPISLAAARAEAARKQKIDRSKYECVRTLGAPEGMDRARLRCRRGRGRHRNHQPRRDAGWPVRLLARRRAERSLLRAARAQEGRRRRRAVRRQASRRPDQGRGRVEGSQAAARGQEHPESRAEHEIRLAGVRPARHRDRRLRRHHADLLRARRRQRRPRHGRSVRTVAGSQDHPLRRRRRLRQVAGQLRLRRHRQGDRLRRRGRRRDAAAVERAQAAAAAEHVATVYETLERAMPAVLARMERRGISIDRQVLSRLSGEFAQKQGALEEEIKTLAGEPLNPGSPKQLGDILFGKMRLPGGTKTKTGQWSTGARELEDLAEQGHALPRKILDWRQVSKLRSTYTEALPTYVNPATHRVHTSYALAATSTGRLSSSEPNLQNIPIRTEEGRKIRRAFVASPGMKLVSADYSQIELRLLSEVAEVPALRKAFQDGVDIHAMTASEMFGVPVKDMPSEVRRRAKAINFGIIYGISAFGLAAQLGIDKNEAGAYIKKYFERFPGIRDYMDETREFCRANGYVLTLFGRKCHYPDIKASNPSIRSFNERAAINARLQGSAADIIRRAMIRMEPSTRRGQAQRTDAPASPRRTDLRSAGRRSSEDHAGGKKGYGRCATPGGLAACPAAGRRPRRGQLGRGALVHKLLHHLI